MGDLYVVAGEDGWAVGVYPDEVGAWLAAAAHAHEVLTAEGEEDQPLRWIIERFEGYEAIVSLSAKCHGHDNLANYVITHLVFPGDALIFGPQLSASV